MDVKKCLVCGKEKLESGFMKRSGSSNRRGTCRVCLRQRQRYPYTKQAEMSMNGETMQDSKLLREIVSISKSKRNRRRKRRKLSTSLPSKHGEKREEHAITAKRPLYKPIEPLKGAFTFQAVILNDRGKGMIRLRGLRETGKRWSTEIPTEMAVRMVEEGAAGIISPSLIHKLYTKTDFRLLVLQRDDYKCHYCGRYGDTIDHVMPKSKGGLSTPMNCVCACSDCNLKKADRLEFVYDEFL